MPGGGERSPAGHDRPCAAAFLGSAEPGVMSRYGHDTSTGVTVEAGDEEGMLFTALTRPAGKVGLRAHPLLLRQLQRWWLSTRYPDFANSFPLHGCATVPDSHRLALEERHFSTARTLAAGPSQCGRCQGKQAPPDRGVRGCRVCQLDWDQSSSSGLSTTRVSVVSSREAMDAAFASAERVTLTGSMTPLAMRSWYSPILAL